MDYINLFLIKQELEKKGKEYDSESMLEIALNRDEFLKYREIIGAKNSEETSKLKSDLFQDIIDLSLEEIKYLLENNKNPEDKISDFKNTLKKLESKYEETFDQELEAIKISKEKKEILNELIIGTEKVLNFFSDEILLELNVKNSNEDFIDSVNTAFFDENIHDFLFKNNTKKEINEYSDFFTYFVEQYSPSSKTEGFSKLYAYCISGNLFKDYINNENQIQEWYKRAKENSSDLSISILKDKIKERCVELYIPLKLQKIKDLNGNYNKYITEGYVNKNSHSFFCKTPASFFDYVIKDVKNENKYLLFRTTANLQENDIYKHDESRISEDFAIQEYSKSNKIEIEVFDLYKSHKTKDLYKMDFINDENIEEIKEIFDTSVNISVSKFTGLYSNLIFLGDRQYEKEYLKSKNYYNLATKVLNTMLVNGYNVKVKDLAINVIKWLDKNISVENDLDNREILINEINPLLKKIRSNYRDDNEIVNAVKLTINALGNGSPNKAYASSLINEKIDKYNKEKAILNNINNINPLDIFSIKDRDSLNENFEKFTKIFLNYHNFINKMECNFVRNNSTRLKQVIYNESTTDNKIINQYKKINDFFFPIRNYYSKEDFIFKDKNEKGLNRYNINDINVMTKDLLNSRDLMGGLKEQCKFEEIIEVLNNFSNIFNIENIKEDFQNSKIGFSNQYLSMRDNQHKIKEIQKEIETISNYFNTYYEKINNNLKQYTSILENKISKNTKNMDELIKIEEGLSDLPEIDEKALLKIIEKIENLEGNQKEQIKKRKLYNIK